MKEKINDFDKKIIAFKEDLLNIPVRDLRNPKILEELTEIRIAINDIFSIIKIPKRDY